MGNMIPNYGKVMEAYKSDKVPAKWKKLWHRYTGVVILTAILGLALTPGAFDCDGTTQCDETRSSCGLGETMCTSAYNTCCSAAEGFNIMKMVANALKGIALGNLFHVICGIPVALQNKIASVVKAESIVRAESSFTDGGKTVIFAVKLTLCQKVYHFFVGGFISLVTFALKMLAYGGIDLQSAWFPAPFYEFGKNKSLASNLKVKGAPLELNANMEDAYMYWADEKLMKMIPLYGTFCIKASKYNKWLDSHVIWKENPPPGFNQKFQIFNDRLNLCQRIKLFLFSLLGGFGLIPFFSLFYFKYNMTLRLKNLHLGGSKPTWDESFGFFGILGAYCAGFCGFCPRKMLVYCDNHIKLVPLTQEEIAEDDDDEDILADDSKVHPEGGAP